MCVLYLEGLFTREIKSHGFGLYLSPAEPAQTLIVINVTERTDSYVEDKLFHAARWGLCDINYLKYSTYVDVPTTCDVHCHTGASIRSIVLQSQPMSIEDLFTLSAVNITNRYLQLTLQLYLHYLAILMGWEQKPRHSLSH